MTQEREPELFIGGPADGQWRTILHGDNSTMVINQDYEPVNDLPVINVAPPVQFSNYHRFGFEVALNKVRFVWVFNGMTVPEAFDRLLNGYHPNATQK